MPYLDTYELKRKTATVTFMARRCRVRATAWQSLSFHTSFGYLSLNPMYPVISPTGINYDASILCAGTK